MLSASLPLNSLFASGWRFSSHYAFTMCWCFSPTLQLLEANRSLSLAQLQQVQELQTLRSQMESSVPKACLDELQNRLAREKEMVRQLQGELNFQAEQMRRQLATHQVRRSCTWFPLIPDGVESSRIVEHLCWMSQIGCRWSHEWAPKPAMVPFHFSLLKGFGSGLQCNVKPFPHIIFLTLNGPGELVFARMYSKTGERCGWKSVLNPNGISFHVTVNWEYGLLSVCLSQMFPGILVENTVRENIGRLLV